MTNAFDIADQVGLQTTLDLQRGDFVIQYIGEAIIDAMYAHRYFFRFSLL